MIWIILYIIGMSALAIFTAKKLYDKKKAAGHVEPFVIKDAFKKDAEKQDKKQEVTTTKKED